VVVGDSSGLLHFLSREDGTPMDRMSTDGTGIAATPVAAGNTLVVVTRGGVSVRGLPMVVLNDRPPDRQR